MKIGLFGASTGAAAALITAAERVNEVAAVVSRGGRPDLAMESLSRVIAPTLLIVGQLDHDVIELNQRAYAQLQTEKRLDIVTANFTGRAVQPIPPVYSAEKVAGAILRLVRLPGARSWLAMPRN